ncbi:hypothetical protein Sru01_31520 [Sphaerisporangium rufum]|uniref:Cellulose synthase n=1 Tax=Sphaerisporangium rufum TaxID=1381558 RepID=A0A919R6L9_9ACTN|nr:cellulose synthase [Sphaerisporangium rufum]GII78170.1 hypothetical protein Sru01_31520 [Sphaerisporangium rufum]
MTFDQIAWLPLCGGITAVGLVLSFLAFRRRGAGAGLRGVAWSLIPAAAYLTGALPALWQVGSALTGFVAGLVLSPKVWAGVGLAGLSLVLFLVSGGLRRRRLRAAGAAAAGNGGNGGNTPAGRPATRPAGAEPAAVGGAASGAPTQPNTRPMAARPARPAADDDLSDIEEILKRRGIS